MWSEPEQQWECATQFTVELMSTGFTAESQSGEVNTICENGSIWVRIGKWLITVNMVTVPKKKKEKKILFFYWLKLIFKKSKSTDLTAIQNIMFFCQILKCLVGLGLVGFSRQYVGMWFCTQQKTKTKSDAKVNSVKQYNIT